MAERTSYKPGTPSWVDIGVPDTAKAAEFYGAVFGWDAAIDPRPEAGGYGMFTLRGLNVAGLGPQQNPDMPPYWSVYVTRGRRRRDACRGRRGRRHHHRRPHGRVRCRPHGRHPGLGRVLRLDVAAQPAHRRAARERDRQRSAGTSWPPPTSPPPPAFYTSVFGWGVDRRHRRRLRRSSRSTATSCAAPTPTGEGEFPAWSIWFTVDDVDASAAQVKELGGSVYVEPNDMDFGRGAVVADPAGAVFGIASVNAPAA